MSPAVSERPASAETTSIGVVVRLIGIVVPASCVASPCGSSAMYSWPSRVLILIAAVVWLPTQASLTSNWIRTFVPCSAIESTVPTFTPAMRTSSPLRSPPASVKSAEYVVPVPMIWFE